MTRSSPAYLRAVLLGLALVAALSGTVARQAEAAADLARTMAEMGGDDRVEEEDGGVGDDALEAPKADPAQGPAADLAPGGADPAPGMNLLPELPRMPADRPDAAPAPASGAPPGRVFAWLQRFLF